MKRFALIGAAGYIAPKHLEAIASVGGELVAACDTSDSVGVLDRHFPEARYFPDLERFDRYLELCASRGEPVDYVVVCTPNHLHDAHARMAMRSGCDVICEKPLVINPRNLDQLERIEDVTGKRVHPVLQLRYSERLQQMRSLLSHKQRLEVSLAYVTRRGSWYLQSWKGDANRSGGILLNIGVHLFDVLLWIFGASEGCLLLRKAPDRAYGELRTARAVIRWGLSVRGQDLPAGVRQRGVSSWRHIDVKGLSCEALDDIEDLHGAVYRGVVAGQGMGISDARPSIELVSVMRKVRPTDGEPSQ